MNRWVVGALGTAAGAYGSFLLLSRQDLDRLLDVAVWLVAGVAVHDAVLAPLVLALAVLVNRVLPPWLRAPATVGSVVLGTVTLAALPVLTGLGRRSDNPTLLDRSYGAGWLVLAGLTLLGVAVAAFVVRSRADARDPEE